jgi:sugar lactone lactonase YvrE
VVDRSIGRLHRGDILVSNFNNSGNDQGTGTTIVEISPSGNQTVFARVPQLAGGTGLTTALAILPRGFVIVGSLPTTNGNAATATAGALVLLNSHGKVAEVLSGGDINGPWDLTAVSRGDDAAVFFTNVLNGTVAATTDFTMTGPVVKQGTVVRLTLDFDRGLPRVTSNTIIGSGFPEQTDPAALVIGPTGVGLSRHGTLYVADTVDSTIRAIPNALFRHSSAGEGFLVSSANQAVSHLNAPLGLVVAPNGNILTVNGGDGFIVETTPFDHVADTELIDTTAPPGPGGAGAPFGPAIAPHHQGVYFVDDVSNTLNLLGRA